jgi:RNA polymerase sigma factor (sigma-70 family)
MDADAETVVPTGALPAPTPENSRASNHAWEAYYAELRKFVSLQLGGRQDTDDVVQEIYREVLHSPCPELTNPRAWMWSIAWRLVREALQRERQHRLHHVGGDPKVLEVLVNQEQGVASSIETQLEARDEVLAALNALPLATQIAVIRSRCDGWTYERIALELGVSPHMVKKHIVQAMKHFHTYLEQTDGKDAKQGVRT